MPINIQPSRLAADIVRTIEATAPSKQDIRKVRRQLVALGAQAASEAIVESFYRCLLNDHLRKRFKVGLDELPHCVNSSHRAASLICCASPPHRHHTIPHRDWRAAWLLMKQSYPNVDLYLDGRPSPKRADLYVITQKQIVSVEFKHVGLHGVRDVKAVAEQMKRYVRNHAATLLVIYSAVEKGSKVAGVAELRRVLRPMPVVLVCGPEIPATQRTQ